MENSYVYTVLDTTDSTNTALKAEVYAADGPVYKILRAKAQTGGRGRQGNSFFSPAGGIYFSFTLPLTGEEKALSLLTLIAGLETREALAPIVPQNIFIKWPNDLYVGGRKLCGVLTELVKGPAGLTAVVGVGINNTLKKEEIPFELREKITSLALENAFVTDVDGLVRTVVRRITARFAALNAENGAFSAVISRVDALLLGKGKTVKRTQNGETLTGVLLGLADNGGLRLKTADGERIVTSGVVE